MSRGRRVVIVGGGHNGLVAAALLAKGGLTPVVLEQRDVVGGAAATEEFHPGLPRLGGRARRRLREGRRRTRSGLAARGLRFIEPEPRLFAPLPDGRSLRLWGNPERSAAEIHRLSPKDAVRYPEFHRLLRSARGRAVARARADAARHRPAARRATRSPWSASGSRCAAWGARTASACCA